MNTQKIAINIAGRYVPGLNSVLAGAVMAANELGWEVIGIRDGFDGLLFPDRYPHGGTVKLTPAIVEGLLSSTGCILGTSASTDPFHVRTESDEGVSEIDRSEELLDRIGKENIQSVISVSGNRALGIIYKLHRKGLKTICIPKSAENDMEATMLSYGFNSTLSFTTELLERARQAAESAGKIGVVEVMGEHTGWLALQSAIAVCADAVLIPEIPYDLRKVAEKLEEKFKRGKTYGLVIVADGASPSNVQQTVNNPLRASLSPLATDAEGSHVIERTGHAAHSVALELRRLTAHDTYPLVTGPLVKGGTPTAVDRQLAMGYGAGAVLALKENLSGVMVSFRPPELKFVPLTEAINKIRTVPSDSLFMKIARAMGISLGDGGVI
ncbi:MAG: 6-phosphofructokinase [Candidatus Eremiobacterota bacterium]